MKKIGGLEPLTLFMLILVVLCAGVLGFEGLKRLQRPAPRPVAPASAPAEKPKAPEPAPQQTQPDRFRGNG